MAADEQKQRLVHLKALRAFEAAVRHRGFAAAAAELDVTPSAISQHVKALEDYLGLPLFIRSATGVVPTPAALEAWPEIRDGLRQLGAGLEKLRGPGRGESVALTVPPSFATKWLLPRLENFRTRHPGIALRIDTSGRLLDLAQEGVDLGIRYGLGVYPGLVGERLLAEDVFPVCSPALLPAGATRLDLPALAALPLLHDTTVDFDPAFPSWRDWFRARGLDTPLADAGLRLNSSLLAIEAAIAGQGVALGRSVLVAGDLAAGRLVRPVDAAQPLRSGYHVVHAPQALARPAVRALRDWLFEQAAAG